MTWSASMQLNRRRAATARTRVTLLKQDSFLTSQLG